MPILNDANLKDYSYYNTGGKCKYLLAPKDSSELVNYVKKINEEKLRYFILGAGSNSLVSDNYFDGAVIVFSEMKKTNISGSTIYIDSGVSNTEVSELALKYGLSGASWMNRLPGQFGATVRMNARCYGGEISQIVKEIFVVTMNGEKKSYEAKDVIHGYKDTLFMTNDDIIVGASIELQPGHKKEIKEKMDFCEKDRESKKQFDFPSCGCVFKNDYSVGVPSGLMLENAKVKDISIGNASVSPSHANFVFNKGASSSEILSLTLEMRDKVWDQFGVWLEYEMELLGDFSPKEIKKIKEKRKHSINHTVLDPVLASFRNKSKL